MIDYEKRIREHFSESARVKVDASEVLAPHIASASRLLTDCLLADGKILACGNGGSAADAQHFAAELVGRFERERPELPAVALTTDTSLLTAIANDYGFEHVFARQVEAFAARGDVAIAISTSGESANVLAGVRCARRLGLETIGFTGETGGELADAVDVCLRVPARSAARIQEGHILLAHVLCELVERELA